MSHTVIEKILMQKTGESDLSPGDFVEDVEPDRVLSHDNTGPIVQKFKDAGFESVWDPEKITIIFDHCIPAEDPAHELNHERAQAFSKEQELPHFLGDDAGVSHQVMMERGYVHPGELVIGADSHSTLYGAMNAAGIPVNRTEMASIWASGRVWLKVPETIRVEVQGSFQEGVYSKDLVLKLLSDLGAAGATYKALEYGGETIRNMTMSERMTLSNMAVELGAKAGIMEYDDTTRQYLKGRTDKSYDAISPDPDASYVRTVQVDVSELAPQVACPHTVDNVKPVDSVEGISIDKAYLGSCTNGRLDDLRTAAGILENEQVRSSVSLSVYPASYSVKERAEEEGILDTLERAGATIRTASCGPCFGAVGDTTEEGEVCLSSSNRNFKGRMGSPDSRVYLGSPAMVAASCLEGEIVDPGSYV